MCKRIMKLLSGIMLFISVFFLSYTCCAAKDLDVIHDYEITVGTYDDGSLDITYHIEWEVLDSTSEGALTWIKVGIPNRYVEDIRAISDNIKNIDYYKDSGDFVRIDLDRSYKRGEILNIDFSIHQHRMYEEDANGYHFSFTPGWFTDIEVNTIKIFWEKEKDTTSSSLEYAGYYCEWGKSLGHNDKIGIQVDYSKDTYSFQDDYAKEADAQKEQLTSIVMIIMFMVCPIVLVIYLLFFRKKVDKGYYAKHKGMGRHYYHNHVSSRGRAGGGGGCACACACACAGGGRAGCATKEFYSAKHFRIVKLRERYK